VADLSDTPKAIFGRKKVNSQCEGVDEEDYLSSLSKDLLQPAGSLKDWYIALKDRLSVSKTEIIKDVREEYNLAIRVPKLKELDLWTRDWEKAMDHAIEKELPISLSVIDWIEDFMKAVQSIVPMWVESYKVFKKMEIEDNSLTI